MGKKSPSSGDFDHGSLQGLTPDDDHTQYALLAGRSGGQTLYGDTDANGDIIIHGTSSATRATSYVLLQPTAGFVGINMSTPLVPLHVTGVIASTTDVQSSGNITTSSTGNFRFGSSGGRSALSSSGDGLVEVWNNAHTGLTRLNLGGTTSSFPALAISGTTLQVIAADGAGNANFSLTGFLTALKLINSRVMGLTGVNNSGTPNTQYDFAADEVVLADPSGGGIASKRNTGTLTNNVSTAGPAANGRDVAGAFSASSWIHFYFIYNPSTDTLATISSATAPPTGPALPSGYTHWAYIAAVYFSAGSALLGTIVRGPWVTYKTRNAVLSAGTATTETAIDLSAAVPPNALMVISEGKIDVADTTAGKYLVLQTRLLTGVNFEVIDTRARAGTTTSWVGIPFTHPNVAQNIYYLWSIAPDTTKDFYFAVLSYSIPNGDA